MCTVGTTSSWPRQMALPFPRGFETRTTFSTSATIFSVTHRGSISMRTCSTRPCSSTRNCCIRGHREWSMLCRFGWGMPAKLWVLDAGLEAVRMRTIGFTTMEVEIFSDFQCLRLPPPTLARTMAHWCIVGKPVTGIHGGGVCVPLPEPCPGDANGDQVVSASDLLMLLGRVRCAL